MSPDITTNGAVATSVSPSAVIEGNRYTAVFERDGEWWIGSVLEIPGALTQGATLNEARKNLKEAVSLVLASYRDEARLDLQGRDVVEEEIIVPLP